MSEKQEFFCPRCGHCCREWVGLTDVDKSQLVQKYKHIETGTEHDENLIAETEVKLKEKNT